MKARHSSTALLQGLSAGGRALKWLMLGLLVLFLCSGITKVQPGEVAFILRLGKLHGTTRADQVKSPGLLFAFPYPIDQVYRVPIKQEREVLVETAWPSNGSTGAEATLDPLMDGYFVTGDRNIVQARLAVKYRIHDPIAYRMTAHDPERILETVVIAATRSLLSDWRVDDALRLQRMVGEGGASRESLSQRVARLVQAQLDQLGTGIAVSALEFREVQPPLAVKAAFDEVQSARIQIQTHKNEAVGFANQAIPEAEADRSSLIQQASADAQVLVATAQAELSVFEQLYGEFRRNPLAVRQRLYWETLESIQRNAREVKYLPAGTRIYLSDPGPAPQATPP